MANPLYKAMQNRQPNIVSALQELKNNPVQFLAKRNLNVPQNVANDPNAIIQYLMNTGQVTQEQYAKAEKLARQFRV